MDEFEFIQTENISKNEVSTLLTTYIIGNQSILNILTRSIFSRKKPQITKS